MDFITPSQCRAARGLLNWSQPELAKKCGMHTQTICAFEKETGTPTKKTLEKIRVAFVKHGVEFLNNDGVQKSDTPITKYEGKEGFQSFMDDVLKTARAGNIEICVSNVDEHNWKKNLTKEFSKFYRSEMAKIKNLTSKVLIEENDSFLLAKNFAKYRRIPADFFSKNTSFYAYRDKLALITFHDSSVQIIVLHNKQFTDSFKVMFNAIWDNIATEIPKS